MRIRSVAAVSTLGIATVVPGVLSLGLALTFMFLPADAAVSFARQEMARPINYAVFTVGWLGLAVCLYHALFAPSAERRWGWFAALLLFNLQIAPVYWFLKIWRPSRHAI